jgi:hypothetical protein
MSCVLSRNGGKMKDTYKKGPVFNMEDVVVKCPHSEEYMCTDINQPCEQCLVHIGRDYAKIRKMKDLTK